MKKLANNLLQEHNTNDTEILQKLEFKFKKNLKKDQLL